jgi:dipeptide transport system substrate-binding protein
MDASNEGVYERLVAYEPGTVNLVPGLAESWSFSEDGRTLTFKLRHGVKWHPARNFTPTRNFNADDVTYTFLRQIRKDHKYYAVPGQPYVMLVSAGLDKLITDVVKIDDDTVAFKLAERDATIVEYLAMSFSSIMSLEYADAMDKAGTPKLMDEWPVGTGPFILTSYEKDQAVRLRANPDYWRGPSRLDTIVFSITRDAAIRAQRLRANECQLAGSIGLIDLEALSKDPALKVQTREALGLGYWAFNTQKKPFDDKRVRQAMNYAVNKSALLSAIYRNTGKPANTVLPPGSWAYDKDIPEYPYDPARAKALLAEAGYPNGFDTDIMIYSIRPTYQPNPPSSGALIQSDLAAVGVRANVQAFEYGEFRKRGRAGDFGTLLAGYIADNGDPDNFMGFLLSCDAATFSYTHWCNHEYSDLVAQARHILDRGERIRLYQKAQEIFREEAPWFSIVYPQQYQVMRKEVTGYKINPFGYHPLYGVDLE